MLIINNLQLAINSKMRKKGYMVTAVTVTVWIVLP